MSKKVTFKKPNADFEWEEALRYPEIFPTQKAWKKAFSKGKTIDVEAMGLAGLINNTDYEESLPAMKLSYKTLTKDRLKRIEAIFSQDHIEIELPIIMKHKGEYELIAGNTRLTKMGILHRESGGDFPVKAFLIEV